MSFVAVYFLSFGLIFAAELGDKTQLMVLTLALRYGGRPVLLGAVLAFALLSGSAAILGRGLGGFLPQELIASISAWVFIVFGAFLLLRRGGDEQEKQVEPSARAGLVAAFSLIALSEMGDKTQIATLLLSVKYQSFLSVFLGSLTALTAATLVGVIVAGRLHRFLPAGFVSPLSGLLFILLGLAALLFA